MRQKNRPLAAIVMTSLVALLLVALGSCNDFVFRDLMEGENGAAPVAVADGESPR